MTRDVLLVGSVPLDTAAEVFSTVGRELNGVIQRIPDGEFGERIDWVQWQSAVFSRIPFVERVDKNINQPTPKGPQYRVRAGFPTAAVQFGPLGYAAAAEKSYKAFVAAKEKGQISGEC